MGPSLFDHVGARRGPLVHRAVLRPRRRRQLRRDRANRSIVGQYHPVHPPWRVPERTVFDHVGPRRAPLVHSILWNKIGEIDPSTGNVTEFNLPTSGSGPSGIASGPNGTVWFTEYNGNKIGRLDPSTGAVTEFNVPTTEGYPNAITTGPDGALWFTEETGKIGRLEPSTGQITEFNDPARYAGLDQITTGPDGGPLVHGVR